ncbi:MAG: c-type cytochrome [Opitutaceae bacterium]
MKHRLCFAWLFLPAAVWSADVKTDGRSGPSLLPAREQLPLFHVPPGFSVQLVASDPEIQKPLNLNFDAAGRLWVTGTSLYPWPARRDAVGQPIAAFDANWNDNPVAFRATSTPPTPEDAGRDTVRVLSDFGPDGRARRIEVFADGLNIPIGVQPLPRKPGAKGDTVIVHSIPAIWKLEDTDGDGRADTRERLYGDFGFKDTHGMASSFLYWVDGWIYGTHGFANRSEVRDGSGATTILESGNTYRFRPDGSRFEVWTRGQTNPFGLAFDGRGDLYTSDSHSKPVYLLVHGGYYEGINKQHDGLGFAPAITTDNHGSTAIAGIASYSASYFPGDYFGNLFNGNPVTRRINRVRLEWTGSTPKAVRQPDFLTCDDPSFRPVQVRLGPDGALWIADFYNPIIGHYESPLTHPDRDRAHGRIWRVVWHGEDYSQRTPPVMPDLARMEATGLVAALDDSNLAVRVLAVQELVDRVGGETARSALAAAPGSGPNLARAFAEARLGKAWAAPTAPVKSSEDALVPLRLLADRGNLGEVERRWVERTVAQTEPGHAWRAVADLCLRHPAPWQAPLLLQMQGLAPAGDTELVYALRLALKTQVAAASLAELNTWSETVLGAAARLADVAVAVPSTTSAEFLIGYLERTSFSDERSGDYARHVVQNLAPERMNRVEGLIRALTRAPLDYQVSLAEGLASASLRPDRPLPPEARSWMIRLLVSTLADKDRILMRRAVDALREVDVPEKVAPVARLAEGTDGEYGLRFAAIRALPADAPAGVVALGTVLGRATDSLQLRKQAAVQLGTKPGEAAARAALLAGLPGAPADLALTIATALARSEAGARDLVAAVAAGRAPASLLRHRNLTTAFSTLPDGLRARASELTAALPPEDARLDALISQRIAAFAQAKPDPARGAAIFAQQCVACHRLGGAGGLIGPNLDGIAVRGANRLIEDILDPSRNVDPAFRLVSLTLRNGETRSGMNLREEAGAFRLTDPATGGEEVVVKSSVASTSVGAGSPMPAAFESSIPEKDFFDLLSHLLRPSS